MDVVGDAWTLLVLRDAFNGTRRFEQFRESLGVADNVLSARLKALVGHGVLERRRYSERPERFEYRLTPKGRDLSRVLLALAQWGNAWTDDAGRGPLRFRHRTCGQETTGVDRCSACGEEQCPTDVVRLGWPTAAEA